MDQNAPLLTIPSWTATSHDASDAPASSLHDIDAELADDGLGEVIPGTVPEVFNRLSAPAQRMGFFEAIWVSLQRKLTRR